MGLDQVGCCCLVVGVLPRISELGAEPGRSARPDERRSDISARVACGYGRLGRVSQWLETGRSNRWVLRYCGCHDRDRPVLGSPVGTKHPGLAVPYIAAHILTYGCVRSETLPNQHPRSAGSQ